MRPPAPVGSPGTVRPAGVPRPASRVLASLFACLALQVSTSAAQTVGTLTGTITGTVTDATGAVVEGVAITISSPALMQPRTTVTSAEGLYRFPALAPGEYTIELAREGFATVRQAGIHVGLASTATIDVSLRVAAVQANVIVGRNAPVVDRQSTALGVIFDARQLAHLPGARSMWAIQAATPAIYVPRFDLGATATGLGGPISAYGTAGLNRPMVEGINVSGINPTGFVLDYGSFEEISVAVGAHGPEWPFPGVHVQFVSKAGGNQYRGALYADYLHRAWQAHNIDREQIDRGAAGGPSLPAREVNRLWGYGDVNADIGGYVKRDTLWWYASARQQQVSVRQVNFPVEPIRTALSNYSGKATYRIARDDTFVAFGQAGRNHQAHRLDPFGPGGSGLAAASAINESADSTTEQLAWGWVWKGEWNAAVGDTLFLEVRGGEFGADRSQTPRSDAPRFEDIGRLVVTGGNRDWTSGLRRGQALASLSWFKDRWAGSHHFKAGAEAFRTTVTEIWRKAYPGDVLHVLQDRTAIEVYLFEAPSRSESGLWIYGAYASDSWRASNRLTLNLGLRFDRYRVFLPEQAPPPGRFNPAPQPFPAVDNLIAWNTLAPRIGLSHAVTASGKTLAKLSVGQYWLPPGTELGFNANPNSNQWWRRYQWSDPDRSGVWEPGEEGPQLDRRGGAAIESLDPALQLAFLREAGAWIEHELPASVGLRSGLVWRGERRPFMRQNATWPFDAFTVPFPVIDPGPDGRRGTADDGAAIELHQLGSGLADLPAVHVVRNVPDAGSHYWTWEVTATRRASGRWSLVAGLAHTWSREQAGAYAGQPVRQNMYPLTPNDLINTGEDGRHEFRIWTARLHGTYMAPWGVRVTPLLRHQAGQPFGRTFVAQTNYGSVRVLAEPIGTRRMDHITLLDVRVEKGVPLGGHRHLAGFVDVFNLLNANPTQNASWSSGGAFLRPLSILPPRAARAGVKLQW